MGSCKKKKKEELNSRCPILFKLRSVACWTMFRKFLRLKHGRKGPAEVVLALNLKPPIITRSRWHASNIMRRQRGKSRRADRFKSAGHVWRGGSKPWKLKDVVC